MTVFQSAQTLGLIPRSTSGFTGQRGMAHVCISIRIMSRPSSPMKSMSGCPHWKPPSFGIHYAKTCCPCQLGDFWLWYRADREEWCICWYDRSARNRRRIGTGIGGGEPDNPPVEAQLARAATYALSVRYWEEFFAQERRAGRIIGSVTVETVDNDEIFERFIAFRKAQGVKGETIRGDLAALRGTLNYARKKRRIPAAPFVPDVDPEDRSGPRALEYSIEQVAALLEAAWRLPERRHVHLSTLISLSTHGRTEAILELSSEQIRGGRIFFNAEGRRQTTKRRSIVPIAPALAPWLDDLDGKVIRYRAVRKASLWADPAVPEYVERPCSEIRTAFSACLVEAASETPRSASASRCSMLTATRSCSISRRKHPNRSGEPSVHPTPCATRFTPIFKRWACRRRRSMPQPVTVPNADRARTIRICGPNISGTSSRRWRNIGARWTG